MFLAAGNLQRTLPDNHAKKVLWNIYFLLISKVMTILVKRMHVLSTLKV